MSDQERAELRVEFVHRLASRNLLMLSGRRAGGHLAVGDAVTIRTPAGESIRTTIRTVELHGRPGMTTVGVESGAGEVPAGSVLYTA
ncbi:hypothetical protein [Plantactinospora soyae]|uniref:Uncharacterized protein n=1 Tax=Plantactinospora soyae TaxID=1544732 RepID=A0A927QYB3_9ACTN|nr:hypothetical protein [Plantactinospora soyae]MBE1489030.1 hypothetical protein [Plantactinospora soyae]